MAITDKVFVDSVRACEHDLIFEREPFRRSCAIHAIDHSTCRRVIGFTAPAHIAPPAFT
jgi:hypothetical protein